MSNQSKGAVLITGAARRIGAAIAADLAQAGWAVGVHYNSSAEAAAETVASIDRAGGFYEIRGWRPGGSE